MNNWKKIFEEIGDTTLFKSCFGTITFLDPATEEDLQRVKDKTGVTISGLLLELLLQHNGISSCAGSLVWGCDEIIETKREYKTYDLYPDQYLFFSQNASGEHFGLNVENGRLVSDEVGIYYAIPDEYVIVAPNLKEWAIEWYNDRLRA